VKLRDVLAGCLSRLDEHIEPAFCFINLFEHYAELCEEHFAGLRTARGAVVTCDGLRRVVELVGDFLRAGVAGEGLAETADFERKFLVRARSSGGVMKRAQCTPNAAQSRGI
jgi:hypothetical protein